MIFPDKDLKGMICYEPFSAVQVTDKGDVVLCGCLGWMPLAIGNIWVNSIDDILNSPIARRVRDSIRDGTYKFCNANTCGIIINDALERGDQSHLRGWPAYDLFLDESKPKIPTTYYISGDRTCNLSCPSCRRTIIKNDPRTQHKNQQTMMSLNSQLFNGSSKHHLDIHVSSSGEVFASPLLLDFLKDFPIHNYPNARFMFQTNGLLLKRRWPDLTHIHDRVRQFTITIDSCRKPQYEILRRGGIYEDMVENIEFAASLGKRLHIKMVLQDINHDEVEEFYYWCKAKGADVVQYTKLDDWGSYTPEEYLKHDALNPAHPNYPRTIEAMRRLKQNKDVSIFGFTI